MDGIGSSVDGLQLNHLGCRICYDTEQTIDSLLSPCKCVGSLKYVHEDCLKAWLGSKGYTMETHSCELCKQPYQVHSKSN